MTGFITMYLFPLLPSPKSGEKKMDGFISIFIFLLLLLVLFKKKMAGMYLTPPVEKERKESDFISKHITPLPNNHHHHHRCWSKSCEAYYWFLHTFGLTAIVSWPKEAEQIAVLGKQLGYSLSLALQNSISFFLFFLFFLVKICFVIASTSTNPLGNFTNVSTNMKNFKHSKLFFPDKQIHCPIVVVVLILFSLTLCAMFGLLANPICKVCKRL